MTVPLWAWAAFLAFVVAMLVLDLFVLHRRAHEVSLREAAAWSAVWLIVGLGFGGLVWAWAGSGGAQAYLASYLIERSLSVDNIFVFAAIFSALAIPARYQHRVLMLGIIGALLMRAAFIAAGIGLIDAIHPVIYVFGAILLVAAASMLRGDSHAAPREPRVLRVVRRVLPVDTRLHGQRFVVRDGGRLLATPLLVALLVVETADVIFAVDSIPAVLAVTTDPFIVYTSNVFALLGMRALYFLLAGAAGPGPLPAAWPGGDPRGRRGQAAARRRMGAARLVRAGVHRRGARPSSPSPPSSATGDRPGDSQETGPRASQWPSCGGSVRSS